MKIEYKRLECGLYVPVGIPEGHEHSAVCLFTVDPEAGTCGEPLLISNTRLYEGSDILGKLVAGQSGYKLDAMYLEFQNNPGGSVTPPTVNREDGRSYYAGLGSGGHDFLRVPLISDPLVEGSDSNFSANQVTFYAVTTGTSGVHGTEFSSTQNSTVYGGALVATPDWSDWTQDLVFARWYYTGSSQMTKSAGLQLAVTHTIKFT